MAEKEKAGKAGLAVGISVTAAIAAAVALLKSREAKAAPPNGQGPIDYTVALDNASLELLIAIAQSSEDIREVVARGVAVAPNTEGLISGRVAIAAVNAPYALPDIVVPDDMFIQIKGWPTNAGIIYVAGMRSSATNINQVWPLLANEAIGYRVKNAKAIHISGTVAGDWAVYTVEQRRLGY